MAGRNELGARSTDDEPGGGARANPATLRFRRTCHHHSCVAAGQQGTDGEDEGHGCVGQVRQPACMLCGWPHAKRDQTVFS